MNSMKSSGSQPASRISTLRNCCFCSMGSMSYCYDYMVHRQQSMRQSNQQIERSLDRLEYFVKHKESTIYTTIPALNHTAELLQQYSKSSFKSGAINHKYFSEFNLIMENFVKGQLANLKVHQKEIVADILAIINSEIFIACLHPERKFYKKASVLAEIGELETESKGVNSYAQQFWSSQSADLGIAGLLQSRQLAFSKTLKSKIKQTQSEIKLEQSESLFQRIKLEFEQHRIDQAYNLMKIYSSKKFALAKDRQAYFQGIESEYEVMMEMVRQFDKVGWKQQKNKNGIVISSLLEKDDPLAGIKMESEFQIPIENLMAILCEMDLMKQYTPFCYDSRLIKRPSRNKVLGYCKISIPLLTERQACIYAVGYDRIAANGTIFMISRSIDDVNQILRIEKLEGIKFPKSADLVNLRYKYFAIEYTPVSMDRAKVRIASKVDMQMSYAPQFLLKSSAVTFGLDYFNNIKTINKTFSGSAWDQKMKQNPELYNFFVDKIQEHCIV